MVVGKSKKPRLPVYDFGPVLSIPIEDRVYMTEGHRLKPDEPNDSRLWEWCNKGRKVWLDDGSEGYLRLPTKRAPGGRLFTTVAAFKWWSEQLDKLRRRVTND